MGEGEGTCCPCPIYFTDYLYYKTSIEKMNDDEQKLRVNEALHRLELETAGNISFIDYKLLHDTLFLIHTQVPPALEGKGAGSAIVQKALQYAKDNHYKIVPICPFVQSYLKRHTEWNDIISPDAERFIRKP
jgi:predicted GNAT family acetyltransferase